MSAYASYPTQAWYSVATAAEVTQRLLARRVLETSLVLYRTREGRIAVLEDRDAHAPYPLSLGTVVRDEIVSAYSGFRYAPDGRCTHVPTQEQVPIGARVRAWPVHEQDGLVWVWFGPEGLSGLRQPPQAGWLADERWATLGQEWTTAANLLLLHENFADITHVAVVDPLIAPPVLSAGTVPRLEVEVTETNVSFARDYPPGPVSSWLAPLLDLPADAAVAQREQGRFVSPGLWVDTWTFLLPGNAPARFRFTHAITPVDAGSTMHRWWVSRDFALNHEVSQQLLPIFTTYYRRVQAILQTMQAVIAADGARNDVRVAADAAAIAVRRIVHRLLTDERPTEGRR
jgi:vanillate O-demethylase monooxygenase subunit